MLALIAAAVFASGQTQTVFEDKVVRYVAGDRWVAMNVATYIDGQRQRDLDRFEVRRNGKVVMRRANDGALLMKGRFVSRPFKLPLFVISNTRVARTDR